MTDDDNDDDTPRTHIVTDSERAAHFERYPPGTPPVADLVEQDLQRRMRDVERVQEAQARDLESLLSSRRFWRWAAGLGFPALLSALFVVLLYGADKISASAERVGETKAEIKALNKLIDLLQGEVSELRRHAGLDGKPISIVQSPADVLPMSCGAGCTTSGECGDVFSSCRSCYRGKCSAILPAAPLDAGVDAPGKPTIPDDLIATGH